MMKKIVPFNNVLDFNTDVKEITAISLEHEINKSTDMISGIFYITGEYKIAEGLLEKEKFSFELPFDIALSNNYRQDSLVVDVDDFRYDLISDKNLKVNIDLYIDGEVEETIEEKEESLDFFDREELEQLEIIDDLGLTEEIDEIKEEEVCLMEEQEENEKEMIELNIPEETKEDNQEFMEVEPERIELLKDMLNSDKGEENMPLELNINNNNDNENENENISENLFEPNKEEKYVTYRVYKVEESDTLDSILTKYNVTKEMLADYNNIENITPGDKLIIPTNEK